jgi:hypothetical protein
MTRIVLIAAATIAALCAPGSAGAQSSAPVRTLNVAPAGQWAVVQMGQDRVSQCIVGLRSDANVPTRGKPQFMISADNQFAILRVRAAEWSFDGAGDVAVTLTGADGETQQPAATVRGADLIDIALGSDTGRMASLANAGHLDIQADGKTVRLPLAGLADVLPVYRDCLASVGTPMNGRIQAASR